MKIILSMSNYFSVDRENIKTYCHIYLSFSSNLVIRSWKINSIREKYNSSLAFLFTFPLTFEIDFRVDYQIACSIFWQIVNIALWAAIYTYVTFRERSCLPAKLKESVGKRQESGEGEGL